MNRALTALAAAGVLTASLFGSVTAAQATSINRAQVTAAPATAMNRAQAVRMAKNYLRYQALSYKGLVEQLRYEGFSTSDATYGVSHSGANWMTQAVKKAKSYLRYQAFSFSGLVEQL
jgi:hypothetical protein